MDQLSSLDGKTMLSAFEQLKADDAERRAFAALPVREREERLRQRIAAAVSTKTGRALLDPLTGIGSHTREMWPDRPFGIDALITSVRKIEHEARGDESGGL